jgi:hypothetical protein
VNRYEQHLIAIVEQVVRPVAVVDVPVEHQDPFDSPSFDRLMCRDRNVVEQAEAHRSLRLSVVAGRAVAAEATRGFAVEQHVHKRDSTTRSVDGSVERSLTRHGIRVEMSATAGREALERRNVWLRMNSGDLFARGRRGTDALVSNPPSLLELALDRDHARGLLGMRSGFVPQRRRV